MASPRSSTAVGKQIDLVYAVPVNIITLPVIASFGIGCFITLYHLLLFFFSKDKIYLIFSITAAVISGYVFFSYKLYNAPTFSEALFWQRLQICSLGVITVSIIWLGYNLLGIKRKLIPLVITGVNSILSVLVLVLTGKLTLPIEKIELKTYALGTHTIMFFESSPGLLVHLLTATGIISFGFLLFFTIRYIRRENRRSGSILLAGLILFFITMVHDIIISLNIYTSIYLFEYGFMVLSIAISIMLALRRNYTFLQFRTFIDESPYGIAVNDPSGRFIYLNKHFTEILGYSKKTMPDLTAWWEKAYPDPDYRRDVKKMWNGDTAEGKKEVSGSDNRIFTVTTQTGKQKEILFQFKMVGNLGLNIMEDITEKKRTEEFMIHDEKMISIGGLAAGMAHELSNPITGIEGAVNLLKQEFSENPPSALISNYVDTIDTLSKRSGDILKELLSFSRSDFKSRNDTDVRKIIEDVCNLVQTDFVLKDKFDVGSISFRLHLPDTPVILHCIEHEIQQALFNILSNAVQVLGKEKITNPQILIVLKDTKDSRIHISIKDNGPGIDEKIKKRIFEPFFTTKEAGIGTGLGLAAAYFIIVHNHHGTIEFNSSPNEGTEFIIRLPLKPPEAKL